MVNRELARDYLERSRKRLLAIDLLFREKAYADVVRECQEVVELCLKGLLRTYGAGVPAVHDVSEALKKSKRRFPAPVQRKIARLCEISRTLRRDREMAFYGSEDVTPSRFYSRNDALEARDMARAVVRAVAGAIR
ncbi:MAG: HEPN domain-containing protein [Planctomycetes bacterium]|nr:HEPN domain-containing protein [Planctomycetota bacterium]